MKLRGTILVIALASTIIFSTLISGCSGEAPGMIGMTFGGTEGDIGYSVQQSSDGGYIIVGATYSYGAGNSDVWLIKTDSDGNELWEKTFGSSAQDSGFSVQQTSDGGYIVVGRRGFIERGAEAGKGEVWLIKTDSDGNELWDKTFTSLSHDDFGYSVQQASGGGYIIVGVTYSHGVRKSDVWLIRTDSDGNELWNKTFGGSGGDCGKSVQQTSDGGYIIVGETTSYGAGKSNAWLIRTDPDGNELWDKTFGCSAEDCGESVQQTSDGGYIIVGVTRSYGAGKSDVWLIKTDSNGNELWNKTFGGTGHDVGYSMRQASDGGYIIVGETTSYAVREFDVWLIKTDSNGNELWNKTFGGPESDSAFSVQQTLGGGYVVAGVTYSYGAGNGDVWLIKMDSDGNAFWK